MPNGITRWEPTTEIARIGSLIDDIIEDTFGRWPQLAGPLAGTQTLAMDVYQTDKDLVVKTALPGVKPEDVDISVANNVLTLKAELKEGREVNQADYFYQERRYGTFSRSVALPVEVDADKGEAVFENGVLTLTLPKTEASRAKQIKVKSGPKEITAPEPKGESK